MRKILLILAFLTVVSTRAQKDTIKIKIPAPQSISLSGSNLTISGGNTVALPAGVTLESTLIDGSTNGVENNAVFDALALKASLTSNNIFTGSNTYENPVRLKGFGADNFSALNLYEQDDVTVAASIFHTDEVGGEAGMHIQNPSGNRFKMLDTGGFVFENTNGTPTSVGIDFKIGANSYPLNATSTDITYNGTSLLGGGTPADNSVTSAKIADNTITSDDVLNNSIQGIDIFDLSINTIDIANDAITESKILNGAVTFNKLADNSVTSAKIADGVISSIDLATNSVTSAKIADGTIALADLSATGTPTASTYLRGDNTWATVAGGGGTPDDNTVTSAKIVDGAIVNADINSTAAIDATKLSNSPSGNLSATTVQGALNELQTNIDDVTSATPLQITASRALTDADLNRILWSNSGTEIDLTINAGLGSDGDVIYLLPYTANSVLRPFPGTGNLLNTYKTDVNAGNDLVYRKVNGAWITDPRDGILYAVCTADINEKALSSNAASDPNCNETNATTGFSAVSFITAPTAETSGQANGLYAIRAEITTAAQQGYLTYSFPVTNGDTYTITFKIKSTQASGSAGVTAWSNLSGGPFQSYLTAGQISAGEWVSKSYNVTATATANASLRFYASTNASGQVGDNIWVDNLSIIKTN